MIGSSQQVSIVPIAYNGNFAWDWTTGNGDVNSLTYNYISGAVTPSTSQPGTYAVGGSGSLATIYQQLINAVSFQLSASDQAALQNAQTKASVQATALVGAYTGIYGPITPAMITTAKAASPALNAAVNTALDYVLTYEAGYLWAGAAVTAPIAWKKMQQAPNLGELLQYAPASADPVIAAIVAYLNALGPTTELADQLSLGNSTLYAIQQNLQSPSATNGGVLQSNPPGTAYFPGFASSMQPSDIYNQLNNAGQAATVSFSASSSAQSSYNVSFSGSTGLGFFGDLFEVSAGTSFQGDLAGQSWAGSQFQVSMSYPGVTLVPFAPTAFSNNNSGGAIGWLAESVIYQAMANAGGGSTQTGYTFPTGVPAGIKLGTDGTGYLSALILSALPTIVINFQEGSYSEASSWLATHTDFSVSLFGFIPMGGGSVDTYSSSIQQNSQSSGFTITLTPPPIQTTTAAPDQVVPALGGQVAWLGEQPALS